MLKKFVKSQGAGNKKITRVQKVEPEKPGLVGREEKSRRYDGSSAKKPGQVLYNVKKRRFEQLERCISAQENSEKSCSE